MYQKLVSTYESGSTRRFREGRVENIRAASIQVLDFAKSLVETDESGKIIMVFILYLIGVLIENF